ncbi:hypothetical protein HaLaN_14738 [Haematococcus lacustris]|uniref:Uncharacterized protein n=1 Tax=Haematococcus lacustris TaxID=44745 RepID=A0A699Z8U1_HAELA|nr:hypothetical protein HaLaN_14738 [Haematococcus lacustris]
MAICGKRSFSCCPLSHCARVRPLTAVAFGDTGDLSGVISGVISGDSLQCGVAERDKWPATDHQPCITIIAVAYDYMLYAGATSAPWPST